MAGEVTGKIVWISDTLTPKIKKLPEAFGKAVGVYMQSQAPAVQDYARRNAPWTDRTGNARQGLFARYEGSGGRNTLGQFTAGGKGQHSIVLYHTVSYGIWLEVRWSGRYAIIEPTIRSEGKRIFGGLRGLLERMS